MSGTPFEDLDQIAPMAEDEAASPYDGPGSHIGEWKGFLVGALVGFTGLLPVIGTFLAYVFGANASIEKIVEGVRKGTPLNVLVDAETLERALRNPAHAMAGTGVGYALYWGFGHGWIPDFLTGVGL